MVTSIIIISFYAKGGNWILLLLLFSNWYIYKFLYVKLKFCCMQELEDEVFDILSLWASLFSGNPEHQIMRTGDLSSSIW